MAWLFQRSERPLFHDRSWKRADLPAWDARWAALSLAARRHLAEEIPLEHWPAEVTAELRAAGFLEEVAPRGKGKHTVAEGARGFVARVQALRRFALLDADRPGSLVRYVHHAFISYGLNQMLSEVLYQAIQQTIYGLSGDPLTLYVSGRHWPGWVVDYLKDPVAREVLSALEAAGGAADLSALEQLLRGREASAVRQAIDRLVTHLAVVEDIDPQTYQIRIGLLPAVLRDMERARQPRTRPALVPVVPQEMGPEGGIEVPDLRAVLLEIVSQPPRVRVSHGLFQKEHERFLAALQPLPAWLRDEVYEPAARLEKALYWARFLGLIHDVKGAGNQVVLDVNRHGREWLSAGLDEQYTALYEALRQPSEMGWQGGSDALFLGSDISAVPRGKNDRKKPSHVWYLQPEQLVPLREALLAAFLELEYGVFYRVDDFAAHVSFAGHNPLYLGGPPEQAEIRVAGRPAVPLEDHIEALGVRLVRDLLGKRLVPLGGVQVGRDAEDRFVFTRLPRLERYFGKQPPAGMASASEATRVIVQPDFTVVLIGVNPVPAADLAPFCERVQGSAGSGSLTLKIHRDSVRRALKAGMTEGQIVGLLERHASGPIPQNVLAQVRSWCSSVRQVTAAPALLLRCPDAETAQRVHQLLGKSAERLGDTVVAVAANALTTALRNRLQGHGILVDGPAAPRRK